MKYKITNPYESVADYIENNDNHYKTNLHTHSTYSDANFSMTEIIEEFYNQDFDILAMTEHGILGKEWDQDPTIVPLFLFQNLWHGKRKHHTTEEYHAILDGTFKTKDNRRTKSRGMQCVPNSIEANMWTIMKNHVNGYFTDNACEGVYGKENDFEIPIKKIEASGGVSHINHPTDWLQCRKFPDCTSDPDNIEFFADLFRRYKSCLGMEVLNMYDDHTRNDRILWDQLLMELIPEGERNVWGFGNSDAHRLREIDTAFMDFILPEYSLSNIRAAMENGTFFPIARYSRKELGENFVGKGAYPVVTKLRVDHENDTIVLRGINCKAIEWIADGKIIQSDTIEADGEIVSTLKLCDYSDKISCYVRAQLKGEGGILMTQPFVCDDGNIERFRKNIPTKKPLSKSEQLKKDFFDTRFGVIVNKFRGKW